MKIFKILIFNLIFLSSLSATEFKGKFEQGSFILGKTEPNSSVKVDNKEIRVSKDGFFAFGLGRDRKNDVVIKVSKDKKSEVFKKIYKRKYKIQRIDLPPKHVTPPPEVFSRIKKDNILIGEARSLNSEYDYFKNNLFILLINI